MKRVVAVIIVAVIIVAALVALVVLRGKLGTPTGTSTLVILRGAPDAVSSTVVPAQGASFTDVNYCDDGTQGGQQTMTLYYPTAKFTSSVPVVVWVHGGGWHLGDDTGIFAWFLNGMIKNGIAVATINYRLAPDYMFPAQVYDAQCAVAWLRGGATQLGINPDKIGIAGASAGAQVASWVGVKSNSSSPYKVVAVGLVSAPENVSASYPSDRTWSQAVGDDFDNSATLKYEGSPVNFASSAAPPYMIMHGYNDTVVPYQQAIDMYNALKKAGANATLVLVNDAGHGLALIQGYTPNPSPQVTQAEMIAFFVQRLG